MQQKVIEYSDLDFVTVLIARVHDVVSVPTALANQTQIFRRSAAEQLVALIHLFM